MYGRTRSRSRAWPAPSRTVCFAASARALNAYISIDETVFSKNSGNNGRFRCTLFLEILVAENSCDLEWSDSSSPMLSVGCAGVALDTAALDARRKRPVQS